MPTVVPEPATRVQAFESKTIKISDFDFDLDKDGKVDPFEGKVLSALKAADTDGSGTLTPAEMVTVLRGMAATEKANTRLGRTVMALFCLVVLLIAALVGVSVAGAVVGGEVIKESKIPDCSDPTVGANEDKCNPSKLTRVGAVESFLESIFDLPTVPTNQLAYMRDVTFYIDMTASATVGGAVEATYKLAGAHKRSDTQAWLSTTNGHTIYLDATAKTGTITMDGATYPISATMPTSGRRLETMPDAPMANLVTGKQLARGHAERRMLSFGGGLMTSGSFSAMASTEMRRRKLSLGASLMTSGSFMMMSSNSAD
jgi:hypothetical protein